MFKKRAQCMSRAGLVIALAASSLQCETTPPDPRDSAAEVLIFSDGTTGSDGTQATDAPGADLDAAVPHPVDLDTQDARLLNIGTPASLLDVFPQSPMPTTSGQWSFSHTTNYVPSGSTWAVTFPETAVHLATLEHVQQTTNDVVLPKRSWQIRIGKGGQIYSMRSEFGEAIAPQYRPPPTSDRAPWVDEVWQLAAVNLTINSPATPSHIHQAGVYLDDPTLTEPFFSPLLASHVASDGNSLLTVNWGQMAHIPTDLKSGLLYYQKTRDVGAGIVEVTYVVYNFGDDFLNFFSSPWGGTRRTSLDTLFLSDASGSKSVVGGNWVDANTARAEDTAGWAIFAKGTNLGTDALGIVFGKDHSPLEAYQSARSVFRWGYAAGDPTGNETDWRNYLATSYVRHLTLNPGEAVMFRCYFVFGSLTTVENIITQHGLASHADYSKVSLSIADAKLLPWTVITSSGKPTVQFSASPSSATFLTFAQPVPSSKPLFRLRNQAGDEFLSCDPYTLSNKPYDGETTYVDFLGFVLPSDAPADIYSYSDLASTLAGNAGFYRPQSSIEPVLVPTL